MHLLPRVVVISLVAALSGPLLILAQSNELITQVGVARQTAIELTVGYGYPPGITSGAFTGFMRPLPTHPPVDVVPGSTVRLKTGYTGGPASIFWKKNGAVENAPREVLELTNVSAGDSGIYTAEVRLSSTTFATLPLILRVGEPAGQPLLNLSSRTTISATTPSLIAGFVIAPSPGDLAEQKILLIRAVGPTLATLGVVSPLPKPRLRLFQRDGAEVTPVQVAFSSGSNNSNIAAAVGAFPLLPNTTELQQTFSLPSGSYTVHVSSEDATPGDVLFEIYEVSNEVINRLTDGVRY